MHLPSILRPSPRLLLILTALLVLWRLAVLPLLGITLYIDEAQYWTWAQALDWGYFSKPPGVAALIAASTALFGDNLFGVKALAMLCYPLAAWLAWAAARRLYDETTAFWSALAVLTLPIFSWLGLFVSTDAPLTACWLAALLAYLRVLEDNRWRDWLLLGLICGIGLMSKYIMVVAILAVALHLICCRRDRACGPQPWVALLVALLCLLPNVLWNVAHDFPTLKHTADITLHKKAAGGFKSLGEFLGAQWIAFGPLLGTLFVAALAKFRTLWRDEAHRLLLFFALPLWLVVCFQAFKASANANWAAPAFAPAAMLAVAWLRANGRQRLLAWAIVGNVALVGLVYHWPQILQLAGQTHSKLDPFDRARGWDTLARQLAPLVATHPEAVLVAENRTIMAHLSYELRDLHPALASWNPEKSASDHYKLTTDLNRYRGRDLIFVTADALPETAVRFSRSQQPLATLTAAVGNRTLEIHVYLLQDFTGY